MDIVTLRKIAKKEKLKVLTNKFPFYCTIKDIREVKTRKSIITLRGFSRYDNKEYCCVEPKYQRYKTPQYFGERLDYEPPTE